MFKSLLKVVIFALLSFCVIEQSYRVYASGLNAFHPMRFNSMNMLLLSGLIEESELEDVSYLLKPNLNTWFQAVRFRTNSQSMADKEYEQEKSADVFRVAVVGSSWTMATGVEAQDTYHSLLEDQLNEGEPGGNYEFLNFAVEYYGLRDIVGTVRHRTEAWEPDLYVVAITTYTASLVWQDKNQEADLPERTFPFFSSYALRALDRALGVGFYGRSMPNRPTLDTFSDGRYISQISRALDEIHAIADQRDVPVAVLWLSYSTPGEEVEALMREKSDELGILYVEGYQALPSATGAQKRLYTRRFDKHPNRQGHQLIADRLLAELRDSKLLPEK